MALLLRGFGALKTAVCHLPILLHQRFCDYKILHTVLTRILKMLLSYHAVLLHRVAHAQGRIHQDAVIASQLLCIHASHRRADDEVGLFRFADPSQQFHRLLGNQGQVWSNDRGTRQYLTETRNGS